MLLVDVIHKLDFFRPVEQSDPTDKVLKRIRLWRDSQLIKSDWTQVEDALVDKAAWAAYRQQLRDLPTSNENPFLIVLPTEPGVSDATT